MCRERGSVLFYPKDTVQSEDLLQEINRQQYAHLLSADDQTIVGDIIDKERFELLKQLEEDGEQPEACFIKQALEEINVSIEPEMRLGEILVHSLGKREKCSTSNGDEKYQRRSETHPETSGDPRDQNLTEQGRSSLQRRIERPSHSFQPAVVYNNAFDDVIDSNPIEEENHNEQRPAGE